MTHTSELHVPAQLLGRSYSEEQLLHWAAQKRRNQNRDQVTQIRNTQYLKPPCRQPPAGQILKQKLPDFCVGSDLVLLQGPSTSQVQIYIYIYTYQFRDPSTRHMSLLTLLFHDNVLVSAGGSPTTSALLPIPVFKTYLALTLYKTHINSLYMKQHPCLRFHEMCPCDAGQHSWITQRNPAGPRIYMGARSTEVL